MAQCRCKVSELVSLKVTANHSPRHLEIDGISTPSGCEFEPEEDMESEQNKESLDDRRPDCGSEANTKRGLKAALKAMRDTITQAHSSGSHIPTTASSGCKCACEGTLDGPE